MYYRLLASLIKKNKGKVPDVENVGFLMLTARGALADYDAQ